MRRRFADILWLCLTMKPAFQLSVLLIGLALFAGCASKADFKPAPPLVMGKPVSMDVILVNATSSLNDLTNETVLLGDSIYSSLKETQLFVKVTQNKQDIGAENGMRLNAQITHIVKVSDNAREWRGALAGRAQAMIQVTLSDLQSGKSFEVYEVLGVSGQSAFAGTTDEAIRDAAAKVTAEILKLHAQTE